MPWTDLVGHDRAIRFLTASLEGDRLAHAYLFVGFKGVGKSLAARLFAQAALCHSSAGAPCGACGSCRRFASGSHPDFLQPEVYVDPKKKTHWRALTDDDPEIPVDSIRKLEGAIHLQPIESDRQVVVVPDADRMNAHAENAFLKTLEEPPGRAVLVLTSSKPRDLLPTTRSRCVHVRFGPLPAATIEQFLVEGKGLAPEEAAELARYGAGSLGRALAASGGVVRSLREFVTRHVPALAGLPPVAVVGLAGEAEALVEAHARDLEADRELTPAACRRIEALRLCSVLGLFLREAMLLALAADTGMLETRGSRDDAPAPDPRPPAGLSWAAPVSLEGFERAFEVLQEAERAVRQNVRVGLALHVLLIRLRAALGNSRS